MGVLSDQSIQWNREQTDRMSQVITEACPRYHKNLRSVSGHACNMLTETYIEALADEVWGLWNAGVIKDSLAALAGAILEVREGP